MQLVLKNLLRLHHHTPNKLKYVRGYNLPFMNKTLSKAIIDRTKFRNKYIQNKTDENERKYAKHLITALITKNI